MECDNKEMQIKHSEQLAKMEEEIKTLQKTLSAFTAFNETLFKLQSLNEKAMDCIGRQENTMKDITDTLLEVTEKLQSLDNRVVKLETKEVDENALRIEKTKSRYILIGVIITAILAFLSIIIPLILTRGGV